MMFIGHFLKISCFPCGKSFLSAFKEATYTHHLTHCFLGLKARVGHNFWSSCDFKWNFLSLKKLIFFSSNCFILVKVAINPGNTGCGTGIHTGWDTAHYACTLNVNSGFVMFLWPVIWLNVTWLLIVITIKENAFCSNLMFESNAELNI